MERLAKGALKSAVVAGVGGAASIVFFDGFESINVVGLTMPRFAAQAGALAVSSYVADWAVPMITERLPVISTPALEKAVNLAMQPALVGASLMILQGVVAPSIVDGVAKPAQAMLATVAMGGASAMAAAYLLEGTGVIDSVLLY
jgi:hypothetical protein